MWCCPFPIYICGIKFLIWLRHWSCFQHSDKDGYCSFYIRFYKLLWLWFYVGFFLNLGFYYNAVENRHKYLNTQHISIRKNSCVIVCTTASPAEAPSVTSGLRVLIQPASPIRLLCEQLPKVCVFCTLDFHDFFVLLFRIEYFISRFWLCLRSMCSVHC